MNETTDPLIHQELKYKSDDIMFFRVLAEA